MSPDRGEPKQHALGVDFGTSNTVAVARWPDGRARTLLVDGTPLLPSAVYAEPDGNLVVGRDAVHSARLDPARFEPNPKRRIDDGLVLLGERELPVVDLIAAVLARVAEEWHRAVGPVLPAVTLTCPATWGATRRTMLAEAAAQAGLTGARLVAEPVAAATYFADVLGRDVPIGSVVVVHDFGAGTFDASVVARTSSGFEVMAVDGRDDIGGLDVDAAIVEHLKRDDWQRLLEPTTLEERRAQRQLWDEARIAKERLSRNQSTDFVVPLLGTEVHLTRDELEQVARPVLDQTVSVTKGLLDWADLPEGRLAGVFLVGGASRIPLVATLLHRELGEAPVVIEQPELVVAEGSILADAALLATGPAAPGATAELRLISAGRAESATVRVAAAVPPQPSAPDDSPAPVSESPREPVPGLARTLVDAVAPAPGGAEAPTPGPARTLVDGLALEPGDAGAPRAGKAQEPASGGAQAPVSGGAQAPVSGGAQAPVSGGAQAPVSGGARVDDAGATQVAAVAEVPEQHVPGTTGLLPAVDPWPEAEYVWKIDPHATVATSPLPIPNRPVSPAADRPVSPPARPGPVASGRPVPVSGKRPAPASGKPPAPVSGKRPAPASGKPPVPASGRRPVPASGRRPAPAPPQRSVPVSSGRAVSSPPVPRAAATARRPRRRSGFLRLLRILFSLAVMIVVPLTALVLAYGYRNGRSIEQDVRDVFTEIFRYLNF